MDALDGLLLARLQFAANITFHILFPSVTIALGWGLLAMRLAWLRTRHEHWLHAYRLWTKVFALSFALGVVSGLVMSFQFGTNWPGFMATVGNIAGPLLGYEVLTAFFLEATFLGIMLFGHGRVSERAHLAATFLVAFGTTMSAFWIVSLNSWMQTPAGYEIVDGVFHATDWWAVVFNPSFPYRLAHVLVASSLTVAFLIAGLSAWQLLRGHATPATRPTLRAALVAAAIAAPVQVVVGDLHGLNTLEHQPAKVAAMEGLWTTQRGAPLVLFGIPDAERRENRFAIEIPSGASLILKHDPQGELKGIDAFPGAHPPVAPVFWSFRIMVGVGMAMLAVAWYGAWQAWRRRAAGGAGFGLPRPVLWLVSGMTFAGWVATVAGWYVSEVGRQPFLVYGHLRTAEAVSAVPAGQVAITLAAYVTLYVALLLAYVGVLNHLASKPPEDLARPSRLPGEPIAGGITP